MNWHQNSSWCHGTESSLPDVGVTLEVADVASMAVVSLGSEGVTK